MTMPIVNVTNYTENEVVRGTVIFCGEASDDMWVYKVELYYVGLETNEDGSYEMHDIKLAAAKQSGKNITWEIPFDTTVLPDAGTVFRIKVIDDSSNIYIRNITLQLDNHGPDVLNSSPVANREQNAIDNTFLCAVVPVELDTNSISQFDWKLVKNDNPSVFIEGKENLQTSPVPSNKTYSFYINPFPLTYKDGYEPGYYHLEIIGYSVLDGTIGELGRPSINAAISDNLYIDFSTSVPKIVLTSPSSTDSSNPTSSYSSVVFSGAAVDDNGIDNVELQWGRAFDDVPIGYQKITFDTVSLSRTFAWTIGDLSDDLYWVQVRATDILPNVSSWSENHNFRVDSNMPKIEWISPDQGQWYKVGVTFSADMTISGDSAAITKVMFRFPPTYPDWTAVNINDLVNPLNESAVMNLPSQSVRLRYILLDNDPLYHSGGEYVYSLRAFKSETEFTETAMVINLDGQPPVTQIVSPSIEADNLNQIIRISGTALDKIGTQSSDDGIIRDLTLDIRWGGTHSVTIGSADIKGVSNWSYNFDTWNAGIGMQNGGEQVELSIIAEDYAGNTHSSSVTVNVDQSTDIPTVSVSNFNDGDKKYGVFSVAGRADDDDGILNVLVYLSDNTTDSTADVIRSSINLLNGKTGEWVKASGTDTWAYLLDLSQFEQGEYRFFYMAEDLNEKTSSYGGLYQGVSFFVDPDIPMIDFDTDTYLTESKIFTGTVTKTSTESNDVYVKRVEYKIIGTKSQSVWTPFVEGTNLTYQNNKQKATFSLVYTDEMIVKYGQGEVTIYIRA
ncbi:MAG: hypothetical protein J6W76_03560, partial [Spirochaetales bacterium]|nr:hypothetical protein [Spirochaetales bacterium]